MWGECGVGGGAGKEEGEGKKILTNTNKLTFCRYEPCLNVRLRKGDQSMCC